MTTAGWIIIVLLVALIVGCASRWLKSLSRYFLSTFR